MLAQAGGGGRKNWLCSGYALELELYIWKKKNENNKKIKIRIVRH